MKKAAFTLVEILMAVVILVLILVGIYNLFIGGSKTAGKGQWINTTVDQMRSALSFISNEIKNATYPTTLLTNTIYDPCDNPDKSVAAKYYLRILKDGSAINVPESGEINIMEWFVCDAEKPGYSDGKLLNHKLYLVFKNKTGSHITGDLVMRTEAFEYTTNSKNNYAKSGKLNLIPLNTENINRTLVNDVEFVEFSVAGVIPPQKAVDFFPISVKIHTLYTKDTKVSKENSIMATPQVAIDLL